MKNIIKKFAIAAALGISGLSFTQAAIISVDMESGGAIQSTLATTVGSSISVDILIDDVLDLAGFQFELAFDNAMLNVTSISSGNFFGLDTVLIDDTIYPTFVSFAETTFSLFGNDVAIPTLLATINFDVIATGVSNLALTSALLSDSVFTEILPVSLGNGQLTSNSVVVPPQSVPEPFALSLFAMGLLTFAGRKIFKQS